MARSRRAWFEQAVSELVAGVPIAEVARHVNVRRETISRQLSRPDSPLRAEVERRRSAAATSATATPDELVQKATAVMAEHMDGEDAKLRLDAAKVVLARVEPPTQDAGSTEMEEVSPEQAIKELVVTLPTVKVVAQLAPIPTELVNELRQALRAALGDLDAMPGPATVAPPPAPAAPPTPPRPLLN